MIVVSVEVWPMGSREQRRTIAEASIENRGRVGNGYRYRAQVSESGYPPLGIPALDRVADVFEHDRGRSVWDLVCRAVCSAGARREANLSKPAHVLNNNHVLGLFLDVLPAAWGLSEGDFEKLLDVPGGWLRSWRNHEVQIDDELASDIMDLGSIQVGIRLLRTPSGYASFWHHRWASDSPIGARSPWQAFVEDGRPAVDAVRRYLSSGLQ